MQSVHVSWDKVDGVKGYDIYYNGNIIGSSPVNYTNLEIDAIPDVAPSSDWSNPWGDRSNTGIIGGDRIQPPFRLKWWTKTGFPVSNNGNCRLIASQGRIFASRHYASTGAAYEKIPAVVALQADYGKVLWGSAKNSGGSIITNLGFSVLTPNALYWTLPHEIGYRMPLDKEDQINVEWQGICGPMSGYCVTDETGVYSYCIGGVDSPNNPQICSLNLDGTGKWKKYLAAPDKYGNMKSFFSSFGVYNGGPLPYHVLLGQPAINDDLMIIPAGKLLALSKKTGNEVWNSGSYTANTITGKISYFGKAHLYKDVVAVLGQKYIGTNAWDSPMLYGINVASGVAVWSVPVHEPNYNYRYGFEAMRSMATDPISFAIKDDVVYSRNSNKIEARTTSGILQWTKTFSAIYRTQLSYLTGPMLLSGDVLYCIHNNELKALSIANGAELWNWVNPYNYIMDWIISYQGNILTIDDAGNVYCFGN